ncbi:Fic/DOC family protein [Mycobacteroides chelonae]|uniref:Fic/DOC family protein n=1 Tax=Mycobacteroides chelonae TaxID=1774 RepID=UPI00099206A7|nr:Fic family protein [Mycobacteroides chelonae]
MDAITSWDDYYIPGTRILSNLVGATTQADLDRHEWPITHTRIAELMAADPSPITYDYKGFRAVHRHIFQDIYSWAGQPRTTPTGQMTKRHADVVHFDPKDPAAPEVTYGYYPGPYVAAGATQRFAQLAADDHLCGLDRDQFIPKLADHWAELNTVHPFREGNTRTQIVFFAALAKDAGHPLRASELLSLGARRDAFVAARFHAQATANSERLAHVLDTLIAKPAARHRSHTPPHRQRQQGEDGLSL